MPKKRADPKRQFPQVHKRLQDWADWVLSDKVDGVGWNVRYVDDEPVIVQKRNDTHSDPVYVEVMHLDTEDRRIWSTHSALRDLPVLWRNILFCRYVEGGDNQEAAQRLGVDHRMVGDHLWWAMYEVDRRVLGTIYSATSAA